MGISVWQLLIILAIVLVLFGAKRLRNIGSDLGGAIKGFRQSIKGESNPQTENKVEDSKGSRVIDGEVTSKDREKV